MTRAVGIGLLIFLACRKEAQVAQPAVAVAAVAETAVADAGWALTPATLDAYLKYQAEVTAPSDGGVLERARRDEAVRERVGLAEGDVEKKIDRMVSAVIARRMVSQLTERTAFAPDLNAMGQNLSAEQRQRLQDAMNQVKAAQRAASDLKDERARFGSANVDVLLTREAELKKSWEALLTHLASPKAP